MVLRWQKIFLFAGDCNLSTRLDALKWLLNHIVWRSTQPMKGRWIFWHPIWRFWQIVFNMPTMLPQSDSNTIRGTGSRQRTRTLTTTTTTMASIGLTLPAPPCSRWPGDRRPHGWDELRQEK